MFCKCWWMLLLLEHRTWRSRTFYKLFVGSVGWNQVFLDAKYTGFVMILVSSSGTVVQRGLCHRLQCDAICHPLREHQLRLHQLPSSHRMFWTCCFVKISDNWGRRWQIKILLLPIISSVGQTGSIYSPRKLLEIWWRNFCKKGRRCGKNIMAWKNNWCVHYSHGFIFFKGKIIHKFYIFISVFLSVFGK